jgi:Holliday junction resolvase RusA-like endonuclease
MNLITLKLEMPPSVNQYLAVFNGRLIKTKVFRSFMTNAVDTIRTEPGFKESKAAMHEWIKQGNEIELICKFFWNESDVYTKGSKAKHRVKKKDVSNRIKPLHDAIAEAFDVDDMYFFKHTEEKMISADNIEPYVVVDIFKYNVKLG